jgi:hypothetical protein
MAKLKGKAKQAFLRRMARGRAKARRGLGTKSARSRRVVRRKASYSGTLRPSRKRPGVVRIQLRQNPMSALIANPGGALVPYRPSVYYTPPGLVHHRRRRKGRPHMAKKRRKRRYARRAAPRTTRRRRRRGGAARRIRRAIRVPRRYAHRVYRPRGRRAVYLNPRRRRIRRRRNGSMGGGSLFKRVLVPYAAGFLASGAIAVLDTGLANYPMVKNVVKVGAAFLIAIAGRRYPTASVAAIASLAGSQGYAMGTKFAGGFIAQTPAQAVKGLGDMSRSYPEMGALLTGGVGALLNGMGDPSDPAGVVNNYATAMRNMAESDDD